MPDGLIDDLDAILDALPDSPFPDGCRKLKSFQSLWRMRFGKSWRLVYHVNKKAKELTIARIFPRRLGYERALRGWR